jgi:hypothetical protein
MATRPFTFAKDAEAFWNSLVESNQDPLGKSLLSFTAQWARTMEEALKKGATIEQIWIDTSIQVQDETRNILSGAAENQAIKILAQAWVHGAELQRVDAAFWRQ